MNSKWWNKCPPLGRKYPQQMEMNAYRHLNAPHFRQGGACRSPPIINLRFTAFRQKGGTGKRFTWSPPAPGVWETQGASPQPWEARPRETLGKTHP